jgi:sulfhydrogenase subunit alpha
MAILDRLLAAGIRDEVAQPGPDAPRHGHRRHRGAARHPLPRVHLRPAGRIVKANCIIPTGQNLANIDDDMKKLVPEVVATKSKEEITMWLEMLVRAYDPCISCSVHMLDVVRGLADHEGHRGGQRVLRGRRRGRRGAGGACRNAFPGDRWP